MDQAAVAAAIETLRTQGKSLSLGNIRKQLGGGSWRDIVKWKRVVLGNGDTREEDHVSMEIQGLAVLGQPIPPRPVKTQPPGADVLASRVVEAEAELQAAQAVEAALMDERQALKAQQKTLEQAKKTLSQQRLPSRERASQEATLREHEDELREQDWDLGQRQHAARLRAGIAEEALKRVQRRLERAQRHPVEA